MLKTLSICTMSFSLDVTECNHGLLSGIISPVRPTLGDGFGFSSAQAIVEPLTKLTRFLHKDPVCSSSIASTPDIEKKYVHRVYDAIAPHFSSTRFAKWPKVAEFLNSLTPSSVVLDSGCGNGKYLGFNRDCLFIGCDISAPLINICAERGHEVMVADAVNLPYRSGFFDAAISIAVLHHLSTEERRKRAISELLKSVHKGGQVLITVWAVEQEDKSLLNKWTPLTDKYSEGWVGPNSPKVRSSSSTILESIPETEDNCPNDFYKIRETTTETHCKDSEEERLKEQTSRDDGVPLPLEDTIMISKNRSTTSTSQQEYFVPWHLPYHRAEISGTSAAALANGLAKKDDKKGAVVYNRYYHVFVEGELERLVSGFNNAVVRDRFYDKSNWCIILEKT
ncbi:hypothetical protein AMTRI_Chr04g251900 [Amborella trichopoda]